MARKQVKELLQDVPLFSQCSKKELALFSRLTTTVSFPAGKVAAQQGSFGYEFIVIVEGKATVSIDGRTIATLGPGDFFGEVALLDRGPRTATVTADTDLVLEAMSSRDFTTMLLDVPGVTRNILKGVAARLRTADERLA